MRARYDPRALAIYIYVNELPEGEFVHHTVAESDSINVDYTADNVVIGYEFLLSEELRVNL
jgi:uncharacterized protein YuzE